MKKLVCLLSLFFPFMVFSDVLPEPFENNSEETEIIGEIPDTIDIEGNNIEESSNTKNENIIEENMNEIDNSNGYEETISDEILDENSINDISTEKIEDDFDPLSHLYFWFCNEWFDNLSLSLNAWLQQQKPFKVCVIWSNNSDRDIFIDVWIEWSELDWNWDATCAIWSDFKKFVTSWELGEVVVPANNYVIKEFEITMPIWYDWEQYSCLTYNVINKDTDNWWIAIVIRKAFSMHLFVWALDWIKNELTITDLATRFDENKDLILSFYVENIWNMENTFEIQWTVKWLFWYNKKFEIVSWQVAPWRSQYVEANLWSLPSYGWKYNIDFTINGTPYFSYDISNANVDPARLEPKSWEFSTSVFKMPWLILAVVVIFILLLIVLFKKPKQKVVYVQQQPTQPVQPQQPVQQQQVQPQQTMQQHTQQYSQPIQPSQPIQQPVQQPVKPVQNPVQPQNPNYPNQQ